MARQEPLKDIRADLMLTVALRESLDYCANHYSISNGEVLRRGLVLVREAVDKEERYRNSEQGRAIREAEQERNDIIAGELFNSAYTSAYAKLIINPVYSANEARQMATDEANLVVSEKLPDALKRFWES